MNNPKAADDVIAALNELEVPYMVVGALSSNLWGNPRSTQDADFVVQMEPDRINELSDRLGPEFILDRQLGFETVTGTQRYQFQVKDSPFKIEIFFLTEDSFAQSRFSRRLKFQNGDQVVYVPTAEDVIVQKLRWHRARDLEDVATVIRIQKDNLDWTYIEKWCAAVGVSDQLVAVRNQGPDS